MKNHISFKRIALLFLCCLFICLVSFSCTKPAPRPQEREVFLEHSVLFSGETLGLISKWYTGSAGNWKDILERNPGLDVYRLRKGDIVRIPMQMVVTEKPLPRNFVDRFHAMKRESPSDEQGAQAQGQGGEGVPEQALKPLHEDDSVTRDSETREAQVAVPPERAIPEAGADGQHPSGQDGSVKSRDELLQELLSEGDEANAQAAN